MGRKRTFDHDVAVEMYLDGLSYEKISLLLDVPLATLGNMFTRRKITHADRGRRTYERWAEKLVAAEEAAKQGVVK